MYPLGPGDRLLPALAAAGGATSEVDLTSVNLAERVRDEGYYYVPRMGGTPPPIAALSVQPSESEESNPPGGAQTNDGLSD